jgi:hypothetical protein
MDEAASGDALRSGFDGFNASEDDGVPSTHGERSAPHSLSSVPVALGVLYGFPLSLSCSIA